MWRFSLVGSLAILLLSCAAVGPDYVRPEVDTPQAWRVDYRQAAGMADTRWWAQFGDPVLNGLIETALRENYDVRIAVARIEQFLGQLRTARSAFFPQLGAAAATGGQRETEAGPGSLPPNLSNPFNFYEIQLNTNWEIDVFGRIRRATESARAQVLSAEEIQRAVILSVVTGVASVYIALRALDRQLEDLACDRPQLRRDRADLRPALQGGNRRSSRARPDRVAISRGPCRDPCF